MLWHQGKICYFKDDSSTYHFPRYTSTWRTAFTWTGLCKPSALLYEPVQIQMLGFPGSSEYLIHISWPAFIELASVLLTLSLLMNAFSHSELNHIDIRD